MIFQDGYPVRMKKLIVYNAPSYVDAMINTVVRPFMPDKFNDRVSERLSINCLLICIDNYVR